MGSSWTWRKSSASDGADDTCVETAWTGEAVLVRDSKQRRGAVLTFRPEAWTAFLVLASGPAPAAVPHRSPDGVTARR
ncbi:DUF397 domain-containing protein [Streptomyces sp. KN37]|uniref:DUF397 domain-containing protein n=1 Tax=Streptomyces sp. KN37 TaxID=3090667 RepID=UPI002A752DC6|nr:DUF397 domain-containing protein [Streptomyces sp. KN37]WPO73820.1 DUF397 domain-containing protein [Streptomyces sp. KN37]